MLVNIKYLTCFPGVFMRYPHYIEDDYIFPYFDRVQINHPPQGL